MGHSMQPEYNSPYLMVHVYIIFYRVVFTVIFFPLYPLPRHYPYYLLNCGKIAITPEISCQSLRERFHLIAPEKNPMYSILWYFYYQLEAQAGCCTFSISIEFVIFSVPHFFYKNGYEGQTKVHIGPIPHSKIFILCDGVCTAKISKNNSQYNRQKFMKCVTLFQISIPTF